KAIAEAKIKTDTLDARTLAHLLRSDLVAECYIAPREIREDRSLLRLILWVIVAHSSTSMFQNTFILLIIFIYWREKTFDYRYLSLNKQIKDERINLN
ncbi:MAG TPA: hypothetical protein VE971_03275, partial [Candidatus Eisenbacteria bacterium]|nr:hypothetical protein [Candidatus Eisenbacteria bacterium]